MNVSIRPEKYRGAVGNSELLEVVVIIEQLVLRIKKRF